MSASNIAQSLDALQIANRHIDSFTKARTYSKPNMRFVQGHIEFLDKAGISDGSVDLIISNCVINLSPDKERVLREAYRVLAPGGELYFSDVYSSRRLSEKARQDKASFPSAIRARSRQIPTLIHQGFACDKGIPYCLKSISWLCQDWDFCLLSSPCEALSTRTCGEILITWP